MRCLIPGVLVCLSLALPIHAQETPVDLNSTYSSRLGDYIAGHLMEVFNGASWGCVSTTVMYRPKDSKFAVVIKSTDNDIDAARRCIENILHFTAVYCIPMIERDFHVRLMQDHFRFSYCGYNSLRPVEKESLEVVLTWRDGRFIVPDE